MAEVTVTDAAERIDLALRATISGFAAAGITILINYHYGAPSWPAPGVSFWDWPLPLGFVCPVFAVMLIGKANTVGGTVMVACAILQTAVLACGLSSAMYAWLVYVSLDVWKIVLPFLFFILGFLGMACVWFPVKPVVMLFLVLVLGNPIRATSFRDPYYFALAVNILIHIVIACCCGICTMMLPLPRLRQIMPLPPSAAMRSYDKLRRARLLVASLLLEFFTANPHSVSLDPEKLADARARLARVQRIQHELETVLSALVAAVPFTKTEMLLVCQRTAFARFDAARKLLSTQSIVLAAMVRQFGGNLGMVAVGYVDAADDLAFDALYYDDVAPSLRSLAAELAHAMMVPEGASACDGLRAEGTEQAATAERLDEYITMCLAKDRSTRAKFMERVLGRDDMDNVSRGEQRSPTISTSNERALLRQSRRDATFMYMLSLGRDVAAELRSPPPAAPPLLNDLPALVPLLKTWRTPLGASLAFSDFVEPLKFALAFTIGSLWLAVDELYGSSDGHGMWVSLTIGFVAATNVSDSFSLAFDRVLGQILPAAYVLLVITVWLPNLSSSDSHWYLVAFMCPWVFLCFLLKPEARGGNVAVTAAFTYCILIFSVPSQVGDAESQASAAELLGNRVAYTTIGTAIYAFIEVMLMPRTPVPLVEGAVWEHFGAVGQTIGAIRNMLVNDPPGSRTDPTPLSAAYKACTAKHAVAVANFASATFEPYANFVRKPPFTGASARPVVTNRLDPPSCRFASRPSTCR